uniref:UPAR/Ly6 domain-containing protein n=1 Tax=Sphaeramia orbicularis TaxID=375764 RepID=A0A672YVN6_9TELE
QPLYVCYMLMLGEALQCHRCVSRVAGGACELSLETCPPDKDACAAAKFLRHPCEFKCMRQTDCEMLKRNAYIDIKCCGDDMCNTF